MGTFWCFMIGCFCVGLVGFGLFVGVAVAVCLWYNVFVGYFSPRPL